MSTTDLDACLGLIADRRRRNLIEQIRNNDEARTTRSRDLPNTDNDRREQGSKAGLHHVHHPMLEDAGMITYDQETGAVEREPHFEKIGLLLDKLETHDFEQ